MSDPRTDPATFDRHIRHISDEDLFAAFGDKWRTYDDWSTHWSAVAPLRAKFTDREFFLGPRDEVTARLAPERDSILATADRVVRHDIQGWGDVSIQHGNVVDFNAPYGQSGKYGFHYWWFAQPLLHARLLTDDPKYLEEFDRLFNQWYEQRDQVRGEFPHLDVIWYELGLGIRSRPFIEFYALPHATRSRQTHERMLKTLLGAARWLYAEQQQRGYRDGNWQIMGSYGLAFIAVMLPEFVESPAWLSLALRRLHEHADRDFFPDGCHSERVPGSYSVVAYRDLRNLVTLLGDHPASRPFRDRLTTAAQWFRDILPPDQILPAINDCERTPLPPVLRDDLASKPSMPRSIHLPDSGFTIFRSDRSHAARYMLINHGPHGGGHSHADCLSFQLHAFGRPLAIDAGIGRTYDDPHHAPWYVRSVAHNMLTVDDDDIDRPAAVGEDVIWSTAPDIEYFAATHRGYEKSKGVVHRRHITFIRSTYWIVYDLVSLSDTACELAWELHRPAAGLLVLNGSPGWAEHRAKGFASVRGIPGFTTSHGEIEWVRFRQNAPARSTSTIGVLLYPFDGAAPAVRFTNDGNRFILEHDSRTDEVTFLARGVELRST